MVIDRGVDVAVADRHMTVAALGGVSPAASGSFGAAVDPMPTAVGDLPELLDVDVDQGSGCVAFITDHRPSHRPPSHQVDLVEAGQPFAAADPVHRQGVHPELVRDPSRTPAAGGAHVHDLADHGPRSQLRAAQRPARPVCHRLDRRPGTVPVPVTVSPTLGCRDRHLETFCRPSQRPVVLDDTLGQRQAALRSQQGVSVGHEDLR